MKKITNYIGLLTILLCLSFFSCDDDDVKSVESPDKTFITSIKIINAGVNGNEEVVGTVDENKKEITFPRIDPATDLTKLKFEAKMPERAALDSITYSFAMPAGNSEKKRVIAVVNGVRKREYYVTIRLRVPVFGADFTQAKMRIYDFSGNKTIYPDLADASTRCADMDLNHVLIVSRKDGTRPHLLKISDLKNNVISPVMLDVTGITNVATFAVSGGRLAQGHVYICNLATPSPTVPLRIYHWATPTSAPELICDLLSTQIPDYITAGGRFGDFMSMNLDASGDGYIFLGVNPSQATYKVLRLKVSGFKNVSEPILLNPSTYGGLWASFNQVPGQSGEFIYTGHQGPIMLTDVNGTVSYSISTSSIPVNQGSDARVIIFNQERYLVMTEAPGAGVLKIYDITKGATTTEALQIFEAGTKIPLLSYSLNGNIASGTAVGITGWAKNGDDTLYLMAAGSGAGFSVLELPKKTLDD